MSLLCVIVEFFVKDTMNLAFLPYTYYRQNLIEI